MRLHALGAADRTGPPGSSLDFDHRHGEEEHGDEVGERGGCHRDSTSGPEVMKSAAGAFAAAGMAVAGGAAPRRCAWDRPGVTGADTTPPLSRRASLQTRGENGNDAQETGLAGVIFIGYGTGWCRDLVS
jgi:hypothetical protein